MEEKYYQMKQRHQKEFDNFQGIGFAFSNKQFEEMCEKLGVKTEEANKKITSIGAGAFILKYRVNAYVELIQRVTKETEEAMKDPEFAYDAINYELDNHEYCVTYDETEALEALSITNEILQDSPMLQEQLKKAKKHQLTIRS